MELRQKEAKIYLIAGRAQNGKDTSAGFIKSYYERNNKKVINLQYSSYIKSYAQKISNWDGTEQSKPRELLQILGTEVIRNNIDTNFFCKRMIEDIKVYSYFFDVITVSDVRYPNEIDMPKKNYPSAISLLIVRSNFDNGLTKEQKKHLTETALNNYNNYDYKIENDGSLEDLNNKVLELVRKVESK